MPARTENAHRRQAFLALACCAVLSVATACDSRRERPSEAPATPGVSRQAEPADARLRLARALLDEGQIAAAMEQLRRLPDAPEHRIEAGHAPAWLGGVVEGLLRRQAVAEADSLLALSGPLASRSPELQALTANLQVMQGDVEAAVGTYAGIRSDDPALQVRVLHELATLHLARGETALALDRAREGVALVPTHQALRVLAAQALRLEGQPEAALAELALMDRSAARWAAEAELYLDVFDRPDTAVALLVQATQVVPRDPVLRQMLGRAWLEAGEPARAAPVLRALASTPEPFDASQALLARALRALGQDAAADSLDAIVAGRARRARIGELRMEGLRLSYAGQALPALASFDAALALADDDGNLYNDRGTVLAKLERWKEAERAFRRAADLRPDDPIPVENLARLHERTGDVAARDRAIEEAARRRAAVDESGEAPR